LATIAYRGGKTTRGAPASFAAFKADAGTRSPVEILAHVSDVLDWGLSIAKGKQVWQDSKPLPWDKEVHRFHAALKAFDDFLASDQPLGDAAERLFQGPIADVLTHVGQLAMLRRIAGAKMKGENYHVADIVAGRVGPEQTTGKKEF
jgi:hypothetical protein